MCIAIVKQKFAKISDEYLEACFDNNKDGAGIAWSKDGKLYYMKGIFDKNAFISNVRRAEGLADGAILIHCRIGTHGLRDKNNCHPHVVNPKTVLIHNGVLNVPIERNAEISDTIYFIRKYLKPLPYDFMRDDAICALIEKAIGSGNKFALLNEKGEYRIINEQAGHWECGVWYSNYSYQPTTLRYEPMQTKINWKDYKKKTCLPGNSIEEKEKAIKSKLTNVIKSLSNFEIIELGEYPVVDLRTGKLMHESEDLLWDTKRYKYLDDVSDKAYEEYLYEIELRGLMNEVLKNEEDEEDLDKAG